MSDTTSRAALKSDARLRRTVDTALRRARQRGRPVIASHTVPLHEKHVYEPADIESKVYEHSQHFCSTVRQALGEYQKQTGRKGVVVAPFDAELFGHWWFEGPQFLRNVIRNAAPAEVRRGAFEPAGEDARSGEA